MLKHLTLSLILFSLLITNLFAKDELRIFSWEGYVTKSDLAEVNATLKKQNIDVEVVLIDTLAAGPKQMFDIIRAKKCDIAFLTLFFVKMNKEVITKLLQPINVQSKRFTNFKDLLPGVKNLEMGMLGDKHLYVPFGGGTYGFWANMNKVKPEEIPTSMKELWSSRWSNKISLNKTQIWYNIGLTLMSMGLKPFHINDLLLKQDRSKAIELSSPQGTVQKKLNSLYKQSGNFWEGGTKFSKELEIVSSWGPEMENRNRTTNDNWKLINFKEGNMVWLDTINFMAGLKGNKLIAAEIFSNYFIGRKVQTRVVEDLSMISVSKKVKRNPIVNKNPTIFEDGNFVPPYSDTANNLMQSLSKRAMDSIHN
jgi:spermidine/putrescine-binding protein